jgi:hypothetical protein
MSLDAVEKELNPSGAPEFISGFYGICVDKYLVFYVLFVILLFFCWPLHWLLFLDLRFRSQVKSRTWLGSQLKSRLLRG